MKKLSFIDSELHTPPQSAPSLVMRYVLELLCFTIIDGSQNQSVQNTLTKPEEKNNIINKNQWTWLYSAPPPNDRDTGMSKIVGNA